MGRIGMPELILIAAVFVLLFGARRLPEIGSSIGKAIKDFRKALKDETEEPASTQEKK